MMNNEKTMTAGNNPKVTNAFDKAGDKKKKALIIGIAYFSIRRRIIKKQLMKKYEFL